MSNRCVKINYKIIINCIRDLIILAFLHHLYKNTLLLLQYNARPKASNSRALS